MSDDFLGRLDKMAEDAKRTKDEERAAHEALVAQRKAEDQALNDKIRTVVKPRLNEIAQKLQAHNVTLEDDSPHFMGGPATIASFYLSSNDVYRGRNPLRTSSYEIALSQVNGVRVTVSPAPSSNQFGFRGNTENITARLGHISAEGLNKEYIDKIVEVAYKEYLEMNK